MNIDLSLYVGLPDSTNLTVGSLCAIFGLTRPTIYFHIKKGNIPAPDSENGRYTVNQSIVHNIHKKNEYKIKRRTRFPKMWKLGTLRRFKKSLKWN